MFVLANHVADNHRGSQALLAPNSTSLGAPHLPQLADVGCRAFSFLPSALTLVRPACGKHSESTEQRWLEL